MRKLTIANNSKRRSALFARICLLIMVVLLQACGRQFAVSINEQPVYDPAGRIGQHQVADADLQGCLNHTLRQQDVGRTEELAVLSCANSNIVSLTGIEALTSLRYLDLAGNEIIRLEPLTGLPRLSSLHIPENAITDITALSSIPSLRTVNLAGNNQIPCEQLDDLEAELGTNLTRPENCR